MIYDFGEISPHELDIMALAMDFLLCNADLPRETFNEVERLFYTLDTMCELNDQQDQATILSTDDNVIIVDFKPKGG